jgi:hypothetical protein
MYWHHILDYRIVVPDLPEQEKVAEQCLKVDNAIFSIEKELGKTRQFRSQILNTALSGIE